MRKLLLFALSLVVSGCVNAQIQGHNDDVLLRTEHQKIATQWVTAVQRAASDPAQLQFQVRSTDYCSVARVVDRTIVEERSLRDDDARNTWLEGVAGVIGIGSLTAGSVMAASGDPAFTIHKLHSTGATEKTVIDAPGYLILAGAAVALALIPAVHNALESSTQRRHVGEFRESQHQEACGMRPAANQYLTVGNLGQIQLDSSGSGNFDLREFSNAVLREGPTFTLSVGNSAAGDTADAATQFYDQIKSAREAEQAEAEQKMRRAQLEQEEAAEKVEAARLERESGTCQRV